tara:strand:- start:622 stop:819 length:198 start_codon:yes stop_codon:yes gene_type:complete
VVSVSKIKNILKIYYLKLTIFLTKYNINKDNLLTQHNVIHHLLVCKKKLNLHRINKIGLEPQNLI